MSTLWENNKDEPVKTGGDVTGDSSDNTADDVVLVSSIEYTSNRPTSRADAEDVGEIGIQTCMRQSVASVE